jgi:putative FmdB family regulatory protein
MPTYDYRCQNGHDSEHFFRKISDAPSELSCPVCGAEAVRRVSGGAGLLFKGSGFYLTDYGKNAHRKPAAADATGADGKADAKPDARGDASRGDAAKGETSKADAATSSSASAASSKSAPKSGSETKTSSRKSKSGDSQ